MSASTAVLSRAPGGAHWLEVIADPVRLQILRSLAHVVDASAVELASCGPASYQTLRRHLEALEASGVVTATPGISDGETSGRPAERFSLKPAVRESLRAALDLP